MPSTHAKVLSLAPMAHALDVDASCRFYELMGFQTVSRVQNAHGINWAMLQSEAATLMLAGASGPVPAEEQAILLYLYVDDVRAMRRHLLASGLRDGGPFTGQPAKHPDGDTRVAFAITHPSYMPEGEFRVTDPDGYCLLIGQRG